MEWVTSVYNLLASPGGLLILMIGIGYTGYRGVWRWKRELDRVEMENTFLRGVVNQLTGVQEKQAKNLDHAVQNLDRAVTLAEIRAKVRSDGGEEP